MKLSFIFAGCMMVHFDLERLPIFKNAVITIGTFDGVHTGHRTVIDALVAEAAKISGESIIITFHPHPRKIVNADASLQLINTLEEKVELISKTGVNHLVVVAFTYEFSNQTSEEYIDNFLIRKFQPHTIIIGYDHHFGNKREGNFDLLKKLEEKYQYRLLEIPKYVIDEIDISSSKIRDALLKSNVETANKLLGYPFFFEGKVVKGDAIGRTIGFPTANLEFTDHDKIHLGHGVYAVFVEINSKRLMGMLSIGTRPTLKDTSEKTEVNILDFDEDVYGQIIRVTVIKHLRQQEKFDSLEEMKQQLLSDKSETIKLLSNYS